MDQTQQAGLRATLAKAVADRDKLDIVISYLAEQLGETPPPTGGGGGGIPTGMTATTGADPVAGTAIGQYYGFVSTKAATDVLEKFGSRERPLTSPQIFEAIKKGGVQLASIDNLKVSLGRSRHFRKVGADHWGLSSWYPDGAGSGKRPRTSDTGNVTPLVTEGADMLSEDQETPEVHTA